MNIALIPLLLFLAGSPSAFAGNEAPIQGQAVETPETEIARRVANALQGDEGLRKALSQRILQSSLAERLSSPGNGKPDGALAEVDRWILENPRDAAELRIGFAKDDFYGNHAFERSLYSRVLRYFELNPNREKGMLGRLKAAGSESRHIVSEGEKLASEEQREWIQHLFEQTPDATKSNLPGPRQIPGSEAPMSGLPAIAAPGVYDRLSATHMSGYAPEILELQNSFNRQGIPGAPRLKESGKLDFDTLSFPYFMLNYDLVRVQQSAGPLSSEKTPPPPGQRRQKAMTLAQGALKHLKIEIDKAKNPARISPSLLKVLGLRQKEAARWITIASIEADLESLDRLRLQWPKDFIETVASTPFEEPVRGQYMEQGKALRDRIDRLEEVDRFAIDSLAREDFASAWGSAQKRLSQTAPLRRNLARDIRLYLDCPYRFKQYPRSAPRWRAYAESWITFLAPGSRYAQRVRSLKQEREDMGNLFARIAAGHFPD